MHYINTPELGLTNRDEYMIGLVQGGGGEGGRESHSKRIFLISDHSQSE